MKRIIHFLFCYPDYKEKTHQITLILETYLGYLQRSHQRLSRLPEGREGGKMGAFDFQKSSPGDSEQANSREFKRFQLLLKNVKPLGIHRFLDPCFNLCSWFHFFILDTISIISHTKSSVIMAAYHQT